jgi:hypothetical protein
MRGDDGQEGRAPQRRQGLAEQGDRIQADGVPPTLCRTDDIDRQADRLMPGQRAQQPGQFPRDADADQHHVDGCEHRAVGRRGGSHSDVLR